MGGTEIWISWFQKCSQWPNFHLDLKHHFQLWPSSKKIQNWAFELLIWEALNKNFKNTEVYSSLLLLSKHLLYLDFYDIKHTSIPLTNIEKSNILSFTHSLFTFYIYFYYVYSIVVQWLLNKYKWDISSKCFGDGVCVQKGLEVTDIVIKDTHFGSRLSLNSRSTAQ